jgi:hypothetical protein
MDLPPGPSSDRRDPSSPDIIKSGASPPVAPLIFFGETHEDGFFS